MKTFFILYYIYIYLIIYKHEFFKGHHLDQDHLQQMLHDYLLDYHQDKLILQILQKLWKVGHHQDLVHLIWQMLLMLLRGVLHQEVYKYILLV